MVVERTGVGTRPSIPVPKRPIPSNPMSRPSRNYITRRNRQRQWAKEQSLLNSGGKYPGKSLNQIEQKLTLEAIDRDGHSWLARFEQKRFSGWRLVRAQPPLDFLRFCGPKDCKAALLNRGFTFRWLGVPPKSRKTEYPNLPLGNGQAVRPAPHPSAAAVVPPASEHPEQMHGTARPLMAESCTASA